MNYPRVVIAGTNSGVGKTLIAVGLMRACQEAGLRVQPFKAGPDYIDPTYHWQAVGRKGRNLDTWLLSRDTNLELFERKARDADISIIEGVMGLYDGLAAAEEGSSAHLAKTFSSPVILIVDARHMSRSAGAVVLGYKKFDRDCQIRGVILNNVGSRSHFEFAKASIEKRAQVPVLGFLPRDSRLNLPQRHLGLVPTVERRLASKFLRNLTKTIRKNFDLPRLIEFARSAKELPEFKKNLFGEAPNPRRMRIAVAYDCAFNFYYEDNFDLLEWLGAELIRFSPLKDKALPPDINGLYIGGGFPELFASSLSRNVKLRKDIRKLALRGLPIYAECGGLMYLMKRLIDFRNRSHPMVGLFGGEVCMADRLHRLGYIKTETIRDNILSQKGARNRAHIFHWSRLNFKGKDKRYAYLLRKGDGRTSFDGLVAGKVLASYAHLHFASNIHFAENFIRNCLSYRGGATQ